MHNRTTDNGKQTTLLKVIQNPTFNIQNCKLTSSNPTTPTSPTENYNNKCIAYITNPAT